MKRKGTKQLVAAFVGTPPSTATKRVKRLAASKLLARAAKTTATAVALSNPLLFSLTDYPEHPLVKGVVLQRPSARNRSPYVGDVRLSDGRVAIAHMPCLDMGGKCAAGAEVLLRPAVDKKTRVAVGPDAVGKYGTPKCEYILVLLRCLESENAHLSSHGVFVGAHPSLGERVADALLRRGSLDEDLGSPVSKIEREVSGVAGTDMRTDFLVSHPDGSKTVLEIKTVVDTDYDPGVERKEGEGGKVRFYGGSSSSSSYERAGIFPWGRSNQVGPDGEKVVSARAIKHVRELTAIASGEKKDASIEKLRAAVLFIVARRDAVSFRPNNEACPSFARYLKEAQKKGVKVLARRVRWEAGGQADFAGGALDDGPIPIELP